MRKLLIPLFCFSTGISVNAQKDTAFAFVHYAFTHVCDTTKPYDPIKENMILYLGKKMSVYSSYDKMQRVKNARFTGPIIGPNGMIIPPPPPPPAELTAKVITDGNYYKDIVQSKLFLIEITSNSKLYALEEDMPVIEWAITPETKQVLGLPCQKATADLKGRSYEAWFTDQLPYSNGPWKLGGLPGLIVEASDSKKEVIFKMTSFENASGEQIPMVVPPSATITTHKELNQYKEAQQKDRQALLGSMGVRAGTTRETISGGTVSIDGKPVIIRKMNNPIEKEVKNQIN